MQKVSRTLLLAGVLAFGTLTAACGDKISPVEPLVGVQNVTVTPSAAPVAVGSTLLLVASVTADASTSKTVVWKSSAPAIATVSATGLVTGVSAGTVSIIAQATADTTKQAAALITVTAGVPTINTVAISGINQGGIPAQLGNVAGQLDVVLFVSGPPGTLTLIQNCAAGAPASADVVVATQAVAGSQLQSPVTLSFNTAATGTVANGVAVVDATSSTPIFTNGNCVIKAKLGTALAVSATPLTLNNASFYRAVLATSGPSKTSSLNGLNYASGNVTYTVTPVNYASATPLASISGTFAGRSFTQITPAAGTQTFTVSFPGVVVPAGTALPARDISEYTSPAAGDFLQITASVTTAGQSGFVTVAPSAGPVRIDNGSPLNPTVAQINSPTSWINASYAFTTGASTYVSAGDQGQTAVPPTGTNGNTIVFGYAASTTASLTGNANYGLAAGFGLGATQCSQTGWTIVTSASAIPRSAPGVNTTYRARSFETDLIGNVKCADLVGSLGAPNANGFFGLDNEPPTITQTAGPATNTRIVTGTQNSYAFQDSISGFILNRQIQYSLFRNFSPITANCVPIIDGVNPAQTGTTATACAGLANSAPNVVIDGNTTVEAYYNLTAKSVDQAGNFSPTLTSVYLLDNTAPVVQGISIPQTLPGGAPVTFTSAATDNVDLRASNFNLQYSAASGLNLFYAGDTYGTKYTAAGIVKSATINATVPFFIKQLQSTDATGAPVAFTAADSGKPTQVNVRAIDAANNVSVASTAAIPNINIAPSPGFTAGTEFNTFADSNAAITLSNGTGTLPRTVTLVAKAILTSAGAQSVGIPFSQVCFFYQQTAAGFAADPTIPTGTYVQIGCSPAPTITDVTVPATQRTWTYQLPGFKPPTALGTSGTVSIVAVGIRSTGVGIASQPNNNITLAP